MKGFSRGGGDGGPQAVKILPVPLTDSRLCFLNRTCPPTEFCPRQFQKFYLIFLSILTTF